jgi:hypothetical protein
MALSFPPGPTPGQQYVAPNGITYTWDNTLGVWTAAAGSTPTVTAATLAEAAAGVLDTVFLSPKTGVPKDAAGMTGAAILPSGTDLQRAAITGLTAGMTRFNTSYDPDSLEVYDGTNWKQVAYVPELGALPSYTATNGAVLPPAGAYETISIPAGVTVTVPATCRLYARTSITINGTVNGTGLGAPGGAGVSVAGTGNGGGGATRGFGLGSPVGPSSLPSYGFNTQFVGSGGSGGPIQYVSGGGTNGAGGSSGGTLILESGGSISVGATAVISMNGGAGVAASGVVGGTVGIAFGGSGGGSGGLIALQSASSITISSGAVLSANGGAGTNAQSAGTLADAGGGAGGGGGYIVLNSPSIANSGTTSVTGGAAASNVGTGAVSGSAGGSFGGGGGIGGFTGTPPTAGQSGLVLLNNYF